MLPESLSSREERSVLEGKETFTLAQNMVLVSSVAGYETDSAKTGEAVPIQGPHVFSSLQRGSASGFGRGWGQSKVKRL